MSSARPKKPTTTGIAVAKRERKREEAAERQAFYGTLAPEARLARLDHGGFRAVRERRRLAAR